MQNGPSSISALVLFAASAFVSLAYALEPYRKQGSSAFPFYLLHVLTKLSLQPSYKTATTVSNMSLHFTTFEKSNGNGL